MDEPKTEGEAKSITQFSLDELVNELKTRLESFESAKRTLGLVDAVAPVARPRQPKPDLRRTQPKSLTWKIAQGERWLKSAKSRGDKAGIQKYEQRVKDLKKSAHASG